MKNVKIKVAVLLAVAMSIQALMPVYGSASIISEDEHSTLLDIEEMEDNNLLIDETSNDEQTTLNRNDVPINGDEEDYIFIEDKEESVQLATTVGFSGKGSGTVYDPYQIETAKEFDEIRNNLSANYVLKNDIDLSAFGSWTPIGIEYEYGYDIDLEDCEFTGGLDGNNHKISGLRLDNTSLCEYVSECEKLKDKQIDSVYGGLFAILSGDISNVVIENCVVDINNFDLVDSDGVSFGFKSFGIIAGWQQNEGKISDCEVSGTVSIGKIEEYVLRNVAFGAIAGFSEGPISGCYSQASISCNTGDAMIGGIVGYTRDECYLCENTGNINVSVKDRIPDAKVGGIAGESIGANIRKCTNRGTIYNCMEEEEKTTTCGITGGIVGDADITTITECVNYGDIFAVDGKAGGIAGEHIGRIGYEYKLCSCINYAHTIKAVYYYEEKEQTEMSYWYANRICCFWTAELENNYSISSTLVNDEIPTEEIGADRGNGANMEEHSIGDDEYAYECVCDWVESTFTLNNIKYLRYDNNFVSAKYVKMNDNDPASDWIMATSDGFYRGIDGWKDIFWGATTVDDAEQILVSLIDNWNNDVTDLAAAKEAKKWSSIILNSYKAYARENIDALGLTDEDIKNIETIVKENNGDLEKALLANDYKSFNKMLKKQGFADDSNVIKSLDKFESNRVYMNEISEKLNILSEGASVIEFSGDTIDRYFQLQTLYEADEIYLDMLRYIRDNCYYSVGSEAAGNLYDVISGDKKEAIHFCTKEIQGYAIDKIIDFLGEGVDKFSVTAMLARKGYKIGVDISNTLFKTGTQQELRDSLRTLVYLSNAVARWMQEEFTAYANDRTEEKAKRVYFSVYMTMKLRIQSEETLQNLQKAQKILGLPFRNSRWYEVSSSVSNTLEIKRNELFGKNKIRGYNTVLISCPVDVLIFDHNRDLLYTIVDGKEEKGQIANNLFYSEVFNPISDDYFKYVCIPMDTDYEIKIKSNDLGTVDCIYEAIKGDGISEYTMFEDVKVDKGTSIDVDFSNKTYCVTTTDGNKENGQFIPQTKENYIALKSLALTAIGKLKTGEKQIVPVTYAPYNTTEKMCYWTSSNESVVSVNQDGVVTGKAEGSATIKCVSIYDDSINASIDISVSSSTGVNRIVAGQKINLKEVCFPDVTEPIACYTVSNKKVASVSKSILTGKKAGEITVTAQKKAGKNKYTDVATCKLIVLNKPKIKFFKPMTYDGQTIYAANYFTTTDTSLLGATYWESSKPGIVEVIDVKTGTLKAHKPGSAKITAYFGEKGKKGTLKVSASLNVKKPSFQKSSYKIQTGGKAKLAMKNVTVALNPEWTVENPSVATATKQVDKKGKLTGKVVVSGLSAGDTRLKAVIDGQEYYCDIHVVAPTISKKTMTLKVNKTATVTLKNTKIKKADISWYSENPDIAEVSSSGKIKANSKGQAVIYTEAGGVRNECLVTVK